MTGEGPSSTMSTQEAVARGRSSTGKGRKVLWLMLVTFSILFAIGGLSALLIYDRATKPDRSTPGVVALQFLQAALIDNDVNTAALFTCHSWPADVAVNQAAAGVPADVSISWSTERTTQLDQEHAEVMIRIQFSYSDGGVIQAQVAHWRLNTVDEGGWRVCSLSRDS